MCASTVKAAKRRHRPYAMFGVKINDPEAVKRVTGDHLPVPQLCRYCGGPVELVDNAKIYGQSYGWPLAYVCANTQCHARVGCHPGTDIPLGTLADAVTIKARREAHKAFDATWQGKTGWHRSKAYQALARILGRKTVHIAWLDASECRRVVEICAAGALV